MWVPWVSVRRRMSVTEVWARRRRLIAEVIMC